MTKGANINKAKNTFGENYDLQESWIRRQIESLKNDSFIDLDLAINEIEDAGITAFATQVDDEALVKTPHAVISWYINKIEYEL